MNRIFRYLFFQITKPKTMALVGKSGTGKSFRSKIIADQYHCQLIIDDGLLIKGDRIIAGRSAKRADSMLGRCVAPCSATMRTGTAWSRRYAKKSTGRS